MLKPFMRWRDRRSLFTAVTLPENILTGRLFAIGSCFAENVVRVLQGRGVDARLCEAGLFYTPATIARYLRALAEPSPPLHIFGDGERCYSPELASKIEGTEEALRQAYRRQTAADRHSLAGADTIVVTLGLNEQILILDGGEEILCRQLPPAAILRQLDERIVMRRWSVSAIKQSLGEIVAAARALNPGATLLFTVSPVPLDATFRPVDVRIANAGSKCSLYAALHEFLAEDESLYYFPAFEHAQGLAGEMRFWEDDGRHVSAAGVGALMTLFVTYAGEKTGFRNRGPGISTYVLMHAMRSFLSRRLRRWKIIR